MNLVPAAIRRRNATPLRRPIAIPPAWQGGFASRQFRLYAIAQFISFTALVGQLVVRGWMVQELTYSPFLVSMVPSLHLLPGLVIGPAGGLLADRFDRRAVVFAGEVMMLAAYASLAAISWAGVVEAWHVLATTALIGISYALSSPARQALIIDTVPAHLERRAVGSYMLIMHLTLLAAPAIAGTLLAGPGNTAALAATSVMCALALPMYLLIKVTANVTVQSRETVISSLAGGVRAVASSTDLRWMFAALIVMVIFINTWGAMFPSIAEDVLHRGAEGLSAIALAVGVGAIAGAVLAVALEGRISDARQQFIAAFAFGGFVVVMAVSTSYPLTLAATVLAAAAGAPFFINNMAASQAATPAAVKAKVVSVRYIVLAFQPIGMLLLGVVAEFAGPQVALAGSALVGIGLMSAVALMLRRQRLVHDPTRGTVGISQAISAASGERA